MTKDRLPTVSASAAFEELERGNSTHISTGLQELDGLLGNQNSSQGAAPATSGGIARGQVTEVWGPPGTGKTAFALQVAANALVEGVSVTWLDCFQTTPSQRSISVFDAARKAFCDAKGHESSETCSAQFRQYECLTLPHLIALISRPTTRSLPDDVGVVVISSVTSLINSALPKAQNTQSGPNISRGPNRAVKRRQVLQSLMKSMQTLASTRNCAVLVLSQCATRMQSDRSATLTPALNANLWEQGVSTRLVLFKDWAWHGARSTTICLAGIQKQDGKTATDIVDNIVAFKVSSEGISAVTEGDIGTQRASDLSGVAQLKRKLGRTNFEIPDSEDDEDYGWADEDEAYLPAQPQQWQGSEDILLGQEVGQTEDEYSEDDEETRTTED